MLDLLITYPSILWIISVFLFGMGTQKMIDAKNIKKTTEENNIKPNTLFIKFISDADKKFIGLEFIRNGDLYLRAKIHGSDKNDALLKSVHVFSQVLKDIQQSCQIENNTSTKRI